jgi:predicted lipid-binding transport protein (Tim44 family)
MKSIQSKRLKNVLNVIAVSCTALSLLASPIAEARRLGGGSGSKIGRPANNAVFQRPAAPMAAPRPSAPAPSYNAPAPAAKPANKWLGPLAGVAAGLGLAALMSNSGMGGMGGGIADMLSSLLMYGVLAVLALFVYRKFFARKLQPNAVGGVGANQSAFQAQPQQHIQPTQYSNANPHSNGVNDGVDSAAYASTNHASISDVNAFTNNAKSQYTALQAAWDAGDLGKLRTMATDNLFMDLAQEIANRKGAPNHTEIMNLHCELLDVRDEGSETVATLRFTGTAREDNNPTTGIEDIWMLTKPANAASGWLLAGVENK